MSDKTTDLHLLRLMAYPPGSGPYVRYDVTVVATGEVIISGEMPYDQDAVRSACQAYHARVDNSMPDPQTMDGLSKSVLIAAARLLIDSEEDADFPIAEIMLRNILIERAAAEGNKRLDKIGAVA